MRILLLASLGLTLVACASSSSSSGSSGQSGATPTFRANVMPILTQSCALASCHGSSASNLGIYISYDPTQVHTALMAESPTAKGFHFVVPGNADQSYLQLKIDGTQSKASSACGACGASMPLDLPPLSQAKRDAIRAWIEAGAKDD